MGFGEERRWAAGVSSVVTVERRKFGGAVGGARASIGRRTVLGPVDRGIGRGDGSGLDRRRRRGWRQRAADEDAPAERCSETARAVGRSGWIYPEILRGRAELGRPDGMDRRPIGREDWWRGAATWIAGDGDGRRVDARRPRPSDLATGASEEVLGKAVGGGIGDLVGF